MKKAGLIAAALMLAALVFIFSPPGSRLICSRAPGYDDCSKLPMCAAIRLHTLDGPAWACESWTAD